MEDVSSTSIISEDVQICRICHGGASSENLLTACSCRGSIALVHVKCLERWLFESNRNHCELCNYRFRIVRQPKYSILSSIFVFLRHPGDNFRDIMVDGAIFSLYTPSLLASSYMLVTMCEVVARPEFVLENPILAHILTFTAMLGIGSINFMYASWLFLTLHKHADCWRLWYRRNSTLQLILSSHKLMINASSSVTSDNTDESDETTSETQTIAIDGQ